MFNTLVPTELIWCLFGVVNYSSSQTVKVHTNCNQCLSWMSFYIVVACRGTIFNVCCYKEKNRVHD